MLSIKQIEDKLNDKLTDSKIEEINNLIYSNKKSKKDLTGQIFNRLLVIGRGEDYVSPHGKSTSQWYCICSCKEHNIILVRVSNLTSKNTKSCGCWNKEKSTERIIIQGKKSAVDISGQRFGYLTAISPTEKRKSRSVVWKCLCDCGKYHYATVAELRRGGTTSCGHPHDSKGVQRIKDILNKNKIPYITEKTFSNCKFPDTNATARFDFYLPEQNILIEYDGEQHFKELDLNFFRDSLEKRQNHDEYKTQWCQENNIQLIRIPYYNLDTINISLLLGDTIC